MASIQEQFAAKNQRLAEKNEKLAEKSKQRAEQLESLREAAVVATQPQYDLEEVERILHDQLGELEVEEDDLFGGLGGPSMLENNTNVKVESTRGRGGIMYVDLTFSKLPDALQPLLEELKTIASSSNQAAINAAMVKIEQAGVDAVGLIFREVRMFYRKPEKKRLLAELVSRLVLRSLKGRIMIKGVIENATNQQHLELAIQTAGLVQEREVIPQLLRHGTNPELFPHCFAALLEMRDPSITPKLITIIEGLELARAEVREHAVRISGSFVLLGPSVLQQLFAAYIACSSRNIRPIYAVAIRSFRDGAVPFLFERIGAASESYEARRACQLLGSIKGPAVKQKLQEALEKFPAKKQHIIEGIGHTGDKEFAGLLEKVLRQADHKGLKQSCLKALAACGTKEQFPLIRQYMENAEARSEALYALNALGDTKVQQQFTNLLVNGTAQEQHELSGLTGIFSMKMLANLAAGMKDMADHEAIVLLSALQKPNCLPREIGPMLLEKLRQNPSAPVRLEIYRLIIKYVNSRQNQLLPLTVIHEAREKETDVFMKREIEQLLRTLPERIGGLGEGGALV